MAYNSLQSFAEFKIDFHHVFIRVWKDPMKMWCELPYWRSMISSSLSLSLSHWSGTLQLAQQWKGRIFSHSKRKNR